MNANIDDGENCLSTDETNTDSMYFASNAAPAKSDGLVRIRPHRGSVKLRVLVNPNGSYPQFKDSSAGHSNVWEFFYLSHGSAKDPIAMYFSTTEDAKKFLVLRFPDFTDEDIDVAKDYIPVDEAFDHQAAVERNWGWAEQTDVEDPFHIKPFADMEPGEKRWLIYDEKEQIIAENVKAAALAGYIATLHNNRLDFKRKQKEKETGKKFDKIKRDFELFKQTFIDAKKGNWWRVNDEIGPICKIGGFQFILNTYVFWRFFANYAERWMHATRNVGDVPERYMFEGQLEFFNYLEDTLGNGIQGTTPVPKCFYELPYGTPYNLISTMKEADECAKILKDFRTQDGKPVLTIVGWEIVQRMIEFAMDRVNAHGTITKEMEKKYGERLLNTTPDAPNEEATEEDDWTRSGSAVADLPPVIGVTYTPKPSPCMRGKSCKDGCEFYDRGFCRGVCYPTYPPQYKRCEFENNGNAGQQYFTDEEINGFRGETNEPNRPGTNWKVGEPMPTPVLNEYQIKELIRKYGERMKVEDEDGETYLYRRLELENPVHNPKFLGLNPVYDVIALRCPEEEDEETCLFEMECKVVCPARPTLEVLSNDGLMIDSQLDLAAEVKSTVENLVKLSGRQVGKSSVNANASRELAKTLLGEGVVKEADEKVKAFINDEQPVEEDKVEQPETKDEQPYDRSGAHKPLTVTKNTIKERPQTYYMERSIKDLLDHLHDGEKIRAVVCYNSRLMAYMPPTNEKHTVIVNFLGHTKSTADLYKQWTIPEGKQVEEYFSHDWWYDKKKKCWTYVCNIGCEKDPFEFMALTPILWDNHTYLGKDKDYKEAPFKYTDG